MVALALAIVVLLTQALHASTQLQADDPDTTPPINHSPEAEPEVEAATGAFGVEVKFISGQHFKPISSAITVAYASQGCTSVNGPIDHPLTLPHGATVSSVDFQYHIANDGGSVTPQLWGFGDGPAAGNPPGGTDYISEAATLTDAGYGQVTYAPDPALVINQLNTNYTLRWATSDTDVRLCGVRVRYFPEAGPEMTFVPVTSCAIFDTRPGQGGIERKLTDGEMLNFDTIAPDYSSQGGVATECGIPAGSLFGNRNVTGVAINLVAIAGDNNGNLKAWRAGAAEPEGGVVVYVPNVLNSNEIPVLVQQPGFFRANHGLISVKNQGGPVHVRGVVVGYYIAPRMNQLD